MLVFGALKGDSLVDAAVLGVVLISMLKYDVKIRANAANTASEETASRTFEDASIIRGNGQVKKMQMPRVERNFAKKGH
jgi:hypothetical protein